MIPPFDDQGRLPPGVHWADWSEFSQRYGMTAHRQVLLAGLKRAMDALRLASCTTVWVDGSFVTSKTVPGDFDACWSTVGVDPCLLDPVLLDFSNGRATQKAKFYGELFPAEAREGSAGKTFLDFFQVDKDTDEPKGIIAIDLRRLP
jgi:hypothetical protein